MTRVTTFSANDIGVESYRISTQRPACTRDHAFDESYGVKNALRPLCKYAVRASEIDVPSDASASAPCFIRGADVRGGSTE